MSDQELVGRTIGGFRIESLIGRGATGNVYRAEQVTLGRHVALKVLQARDTEDPKFRERFVRESRRAAAINHANVIPIHEAGDVDGLLYIAMRLVEGGDLREQLGRTGVLPPKRAIALVAQVAAALDAAHAKGIVHRDVKPANLLLERDHVYLSDFGIAREMNAARGDTVTGLFLGTADYVSPEQIRGEPLDARTDIYSLGCVLYECLVGKPPFDAPTQFAVLNAHISAPIPRPSTAAMGVPVELDEVIATALAKDRTMRYRTAHHLADAAAAAISGEPQPVSPRSGQPPEDVRRTQAGPTGLGAGSSKAVDAHAETRIEKAISDVAHRDSVAATPVVAHASRQVAPPLSPSAQAQTYRHWPIVSIAAGVVFIVVGQLLLTGSSPGLWDVGGALLGSGVALGLFGPLLATHYRSSPTNARYSGRRVFLGGAATAFVSLLLIISTDEERTGRLSGIGTTAVLTFLVGLACMAAGGVIGFMSSIAGYFRRRKQVRP